MSGAVQYIEVIPSLKGFASLLTTQATAGAKSAGLKAGQTFSQGVSAGLKEAQASAQAAVDELTAASNKAATQIKKESAAIKLARAQEKAAAEGVAAAEAKLQEVRSKETATDSQVLKAQQALTLAQGKSEQAALKVVAAEDQIKAAYGEQKVVTEQLVTAQADLDKAQLASTSGSARFAKGLGAAESSVTSMGSKIGGLVKSYGSMVGFFGAFAAADGVKSAVESATKFQASMTLLVTAGGEAQKELPAVALGIQNIAKSTGTSTEQLASGMYTLEKASYRGAAGLMVLKAAAEGAKAENVDLATMTNAVTDVMTDYHLKASDAVSVTNQMVTASGKAKATMEEFAGSFGEIIPTAAKAGLSFAQVGGALATMTQHGVSAEQASQNLNNLLTNLQKPSAVASTAMQQIGLNVTDLEQNLGKRGLTGTLQIVSKAITDSMGPSGLVIQKALNQTASGAQNLQIQMSTMPPTLKKLSQGYLDNTVTMKEYRTAIRDMGAAGYATGSQFLALADQVNGYGKQITGTSPAAQTFMGELTKITGGMTGAKVATQLTGEYMPTFVNNVNAISDAAKNGGKNISTWALTQATFKVQMDKLGQSFAVTAQQAATKLLPTFTAIAKDVLAGSSALMRFASANKQWLKPTLVTVLALAAAYKAFTVALVLNTAIKGAITGFQAINTALKAYRAGLSAATAMQIAFDAAADANPLGLIVIGIAAAVAALAALTAGVVYAYTHWAWFRDGVNAVWKGIQVGASVAWAVIKGIFADFSDGLTQIGDGATWLWKTIFVPAFHGIGVAVGWVESAVESVKGAFTVGWNQIVGGIVGALNWVVSAADAVHTAFKIAWNAAGDVISTVYKSVISPVLSAFAGGAVQIGTAMSWLYNTILKPVLTGIDAVFTWFSKAEYAVLDLLYHMIMAVVGPAVNWLWKSVIQPVFALISNAVQVSINAVVGSFNSLVTLLRTYVGGAIIWFYQSVEKPIFGFIVAHIESSVSYIVSSLTWLVTTIRTGIGVAVSWLWNSVFLPVFNFISAHVASSVSYLVSSFAWLVGVIHSGIAATISWLWASVVSPVFGAIGSAAHDLYSTFSRYFGAIGRVVSGWWDSTLKPVFDAFGNWLGTEGPKLMKGFQGAVSTVWGAIQTAFETPIKFIVNTVMDDVLIGGFNRLATKFHSALIPLIPRVSFGGGGSSGGAVGKPNMAMAGGGVLPGYQAAKRDELLVHMRKGEGVLVPEVVRALGPGFVHALNAAGNSGGVSGVRSLAGYAGGGIIGDIGSLFSNPANAIKIAADAAINLVPGSGPMVDAGKAVAKSLASVVSTAAGALFNPIGAIGNLIGGGSAGGTKANPVGSSVGRWTPDVIAALKANGLSTSNAMVQKVLRQIATESGGDAQITQKITDINSIEGHPAEGLMQTIPSTFNAYKFPGHGNIFNGYDNLLAALNYAKHNYGPNLNGLGEGHGYANGGVVGLYDNGGYIPPGVSVVANQTGKPEPVLNAQQWESLGAGGGRQVTYAPTIHAHEHVNEATIRQAFRNMEALAGGK